MELRNSGRGKPEGHLAEARRMQKKEQELLASAMIQTKPAPDGISGSQRIVAV
jgi:hypothetical protein